MCIPYSQEYNDEIDDHISYEIHTCLVYEYSYNTYHTSASHVNCTNKQKDVFTCSMTCTVRQVVEQSTRKPSGHRNSLPIHKTTCTDISMYFLTLPEVIYLSTGKKFDHALVIVHGDGKHTITIAMPANHTTTNLINTYNWYLYQDFGLREDIVRYQETISTSTQWLQFWRAQHIIQFISIADQTQTDSQTKVATVYILLRL